MKKALILTTMMLVATLCASAGKNPATLDTLRVSTDPQMHCANCENRIKQNIRFVKGVKKIVTSIPEQTVTIVYDSSKSTFDDFVAAFKKIGYTIAPIKQEQE